MILRWCILVLALLAASCRRQGAPELLVVSAVLPSEVQLGGALRVVGEGFGLGRPASVTLRGRVYRPGRTSSALSLRLPAATESQQELAFSVPRTLQDELCGVGDEVRHATFRGDVEVAIASKRPGTPPVVGTLHGAVLDLYPASKSEAADALSQQLGRDMLEFLGLDARSTRDGLEVAGTAAGSRAQRAGLLPGDLLVSAAGVSVLEASDLVPESVRELELVVRRLGDEHTLRVSSDGFSALPPPSVSVAAVLVAVVGLGFVLLGGRWTRVAFWIEQHLRARAPRLGAARSRQPQRFAASLRLPVVGGWHWALFTGVGALALGPRLLPGFEALPWLLALLCGARLTLVTTALVYGGNVQARRWSLRRGAAAAAHEFLGMAPALLALGFGLSESGIDLERVAARQGAAPWAWAACDSPAMLGLFVVLVLTALALGQPRAPLASARPRGADRVAETLPAFLYLCTLSALAVWIFLGGDRLPDLPELLRIPRVEGVLAASLLLAKLALLSLLLCVLRAAAFRPSARDMAARTYRIYLPLAFVFAGCERALAYARVSEPIWHWAAAGFGYVVVGASVLYAAAACAWAVRGPAPAQAARSVSPWL